MQTVSGAHVSRRQAHTFNTRCARERSAVLTPCAWIRIAGLALLVATAPLDADAQGASQQEPPVARRPFSLADAAALARTQHPLLAAAGGRRQVAVGSARQESAFPNPVFEWRRENLGSPLPRDEFMSLGLPVDLYGRRVVLRAAGSFAAARALADSSTTAQQVEFDVARVYWQTAFANALRDVASAQRAALDTIARIESERARQGEVSAGAALRTRLEADRARLTEAGARADLERARGALARALALPVDSVPLPTDALRVSPGEVVPSLSTLLSLARSRRPDLRSARSRVDESTKRQLAERLAVLPALGVQAGSKLTSGFQTGTIQVGVAVPLFDRNGGNKQRAAGEVLIAAGELRTIEAAVDADVTAAFRAYTMLLAEYARATDPDPVGGGLRELEVRGAAVATIAGAAYREGAIPLFELLDAQRVRADVRTAALRAALDVHLSRLDLLRAVGLSMDSAGFPSSPE